MDARHGVLVQSRRHAFIASLLGIHHLVVAVNKMDLVGYSEEVFNRICADFNSFAAPLQLSDLYLIPVSALLGDNIVTKSENMPWFGGASLLRHLETVHIGSDRNLSEMRFPVQLVARPTQEFRGFAGQVASGVLKPGDAVMVLPSGRTSRVKAIVTQDGELPRAFPPMSVTVCLEDELDVSRGNMLVPPSHPPHVTRCIDARLVWMNDQPLDLRRQYMLKHTTQWVKAQVRYVRYRVDVNSFQRHPASELKLNEIGTVVIDTHSPLFVDQYRRNRATGSFILVDPISNATLAAGMITGRDPKMADSAIQEVRSVEAKHILRADRQKRVGHPSALVWLNGNLQLAFAIESELFRRGYLTHVIAAQADGSVMLELAQNLTAAGLLTICAADFLYEVERGRAQALIDATRFLDVDASLFSSPEEAVANIAATLAERQIVPLDR